MRRFTLKPIYELHKTEIFKVFILKSIDDKVGPLQNEQTLNILKKKYDNGKTLVIVENEKCAFVLPDKKALEHYKSREYYRRKGSEIQNFIKDEKIAELAIYGVDAETIHDFTEGLLLSSYTFEKYKTKPKEQLAYQIFVDQLKPEALQTLNNLVETVFICRNWVNEPVIQLTAEVFAEEIEAACSQLPFTKVEVLNKQKIESLKMGGLLAVNKGALNPPTFSIIEYKHPNAKNNKPIALVGKGVVFDTGGLSLKETAGSMDMMKCDMAGAAAVVGTIVAAAKNNLPLYLMAFVPATENRPDGNAIVPSDVITMYNGKTVEILNTDAEGRVILGDALSYAEKFDPELVIDVATLTGAAIAAIGKEASVMIGTASEKLKNKLSASAFETYERLVELPLWEEYEKEIESDIADIKNIGTGPGAGSITAAAFLKCFTSKPWIHLDIAGPAYLKAPEGYRPKNGTAYGIRLLYDFLSKY